MSNNDSSDYKSPVAFLHRMFEGFLKKIKSFLNEKLFDFLTKTLVRIAHYFLYAAPVIILISGITLSIRLGEFQIALLCVIFTAIIPILQYVADNFITSSKDLIAHNPAKISSEAFLHSLTILSIIGAILFSIESLMYAGIKAGWINALAILVIGVSFAIMANNPKMANVEMVKDNHAGEEAIGVFSFFINATYRMVPILFGVLAVTGTVITFIAMTKLWGKSIAFSRSFMDFGGIRLVVYSCFVPFAAYLAYLFYYIIIDLIRSVLTLGDKPPKNKSGGNG